MTIVLTWQYICCNKCPDLFKMLSTPYEKNAQWSGPEREAFFPWQVRCLFLLTYAHFWYTPPHYRIIVDVPVCLWGRYSFLFFFFKFILPLFILSFIYLRYQTNVVFGWHILVWLSNCKIAPILVSQVPSSCSATRTLNISSCNMAPIPKNLFFYIYHCILDITGNQMHTDMYGAAAIIEHRWCFLVQWRYEAERLR